MASIPTITLPASSLRLPRLAFGTGTALYGTPVKTQVTTALQSGFRLIDNAEAYANEDTSGEAIAEFIASGKAERSQLFVLTKVGKAGMLNIQQAVKEEMKKLKVDYLDAYLLHFPPRGKHGLPSNVEAWKEMERIKEQGLAKSIGVSNWLASDIQEVLDCDECKLKPEINQIEFHPYVYSSPVYQELLELQRREGIVTMTYGSQAPMVKNALPEDEPLNPVLTKIASSREGRTIASVLLNWAYQRSGGIVTTTTSKQERALTYISLFDENQVRNDILSQEELQQIDEAGEQHGFAKFYMTAYL
ncbi:Aldo/keto reductase [Violaceomyces palustris]|uniref:Aldo/keto reductase n=1 Tax=Violaceomyces palustris TaxID=1673888 RepID=A0ACD0P4A8_9BASI|nr:Aldo/keto reductase [Violaceomyces palustris]